MKNNNPNQLPLVTPRTQGIAETASLMINYLTKLTEVKIIKK